MKTLRDKAGGGRERNYERERDRFLAETEIMKRLHHPHVVHLYGICVERAPFYLVQELCENGDLLHHLRKFPFLKIPHDVMREEEGNVPRYMKSTGSL